MTTTITVNVLRSQINGIIDSEVLKQLDKKLCYQTVSDYILYSRRSWYSRGDGFDHRFNIERQTFDTGLLSVVKKILNSHNIEFEIIDKRPVIKPGVALELSAQANEAGIEVRDYQSEAIAAALKKKQGLLLLATGAGKSLCISMIVGHLNLRTIIFVHTKDLLYQMKNNIEFLLGVECGQIGDSIVDIKPITVATMQTAARSLGKKYVKYDSDDWDDKKTKLSKEQAEQIKKFLISAQVIINDECHRCACRSIQILAKACKNATYRYGATATLREDGADIAIYGVLGPIIYRMSASELIDRRWLVPPKIYVYQMPAIIRAEDINLDWHKVYKKRIVQNNDRNQLISKAALQLFEKGKKTLILVKEIEHGETLYELLEDSDAYIRFVQGKDRDREEVLQQFKSNELDILIATVLFDEGIDLPMLDAVILAGGGKSYVKALQRIGRALRIYKNKKEAIVVDFLDNGKWIEKHSKKRIEIYKREPRFVVKVLKPRMFAN